MASGTHHKDGVLIERLGPLYWPLYITLLAVAAIGTLFSGVAMAVTHDGAHAHHHGHSDGHHAAVLQADASCDTPRSTIAVTLDDNGFSKPVIAAHVCDVLQIRNASSYHVKVAIGPHDEHIEYPGYDEPVTERGGTASIVLRTAGDFTIHDHYDDDHTAQVDISK